MTKKGAFRILNRDGYFDARELVERPWDAEFGIVPEHTTLTRRVVAASSLVEDLCGLGEDEKAMCKAFGNPKKLEFAFFVAGLEIESGPAPEVRRLAAKIDRNVPDMAREDADEFTLWVTELVMEATENATSGKRLIVLSEGRGKTERSKGVCVKNFSEPATRIAVARGLQNLYIAQGGITKGHETSIGHSKESGEQRAQTIPILGPQLYIQHGV